jgi:hypothetical protein
MNWKAIRLRRIVPFQIFIGVKSICEAPLEAAVATEMAYNEDEDDEDKDEDDKEV